jgi:hypothetical protein
MTDLSPAAQAVWDAFNEDEAGVFVDYGDKLAAALRALSEQLGHEVLDVRCVDCSQIQLIAAELEGGAQ